MGTQKPLQAMIPELIQHFNKYRDHLEYDHRVFKVYEGQVKKEIEDSLRREIISKAALNRALQRIPSLNILKKATDKLSKLYAEDPVRFTSNDTDRDILNSLEKEVCPNEVLMRSNLLLNAQNRSAIEFYIKDGRHQARVLAAHQFLPYSDDPQDPTNMTVMMKLMGPREPINTTATDSEGRDLSQDNQVDLVDILALYSDDEVLVIDTGGSVRLDVMQEMGITSTVNEFGTIPYIYLSKTDLQLIPFVNQAGLDISVLIPKLLTDLNYASQFMSHSLIWYKNTDLDGAEVHPDAMINLGSAERDEHDAEIGTINPTVEIERVLTLAEFEANSYFSSIGIKTSGIQQALNGGRSSGISKVIDEADTSAELKAQAQKYRRWERAFWEKLDKMQEVWSQDASVIEKRRFSDKFLDTFVVHFAENKPFKSEQDKINEIKMLRDAGLISRRRAILAINPSLTNEQLDEWEAELDKEEKKSMEQQLLIAGRDEAVTQQQEEDSEDQEGEQE